MELAPRKRGFGDRIKQLWKMTERVGPFVLVGLAFILQTVGLSANAPVASEVAAILLSLGLMLIFALVIEIHSKVGGELEERTYLELDTIVPEIRDRLLRSAKSQSGMEIKLIGLSLRNQWKILEDFLKRVHEDRNHTQFDLQIVCLDPDWTELEELNPRMRPMTQALKATIQDFCHDFSAEFEKGTLKIHVVGIREFPIVAGILIDRSYLFRTLCDVQNAKVTQGERLYEFFEYREPGKEFDHLTVDHFERVFQYYKDRGSPFPVPAHRPEAP